MAGCQLPAPAELEPSRRPRGRISAPEDGETPEDPAETHLPAAACPGAVRRGRGEGKRGEGDKLSGRWMDGLEER